MLKTLSTIEVYKVECGRCNRPFYEPDEGLKHCPHCGRDAEQCLTAETIVYPVFINPLTGEAALGQPEKRDQDWYRPRRPPFATSLIEKEENDIDQPD